MASRFWVGGTGTWDASTTTHWAATTGGTGGQTVPGSADTVTFDASSGGGTVTVNTTVNSLSITMGAFTGTLDFSVNNNNVTLNTFSGTGSGVRSLKMGNGTWTLNGNGAITIWDFTTTTNLTFNANSSTLIFASGTAGSIRIFNTGTLAITYSTITISSGANNGIFSFQGSAQTIATLNIGAGNRVEFKASVTTTITNAPSWNGTFSSPIQITSGLLGTVATVSCASGAANMSWCGISDMTFAGAATFTANNSLDLGHNSGITINGPNPPVAQMNLYQRGTPF